MPIEFPFGIFRLFYKKDIKMLKKNYKDTIKKLKNIKLK
jgi:hypothetical protein